MAHGSCPTPSGAQILDSGQPQKAVFSFSCWPPRRRNLKEFVPLIFLEETGVNDYIFKARHCFFLTKDIWRRICNIFLQRKHGLEIPELPGVLSHASIKAVKQKLNESFRNRGLFFSFFRSTTSCYSTHKSVHSTVFHRPAFKWDMQKTGPDERVGFEIATAPPCR